MPTDKKTINWYNKNAQGYTNHVRDPKDSVYHAYYEKPAMYALLPDLAGKDVISIGCGSGEDSFYLKNKGAKRSVGVDITEKLIEIAKSSRPECEFYLGDMEKLDEVTNDAGEKVFAPESFDFAYSSLAIHYVQDWIPTFKQIYSILKPNSYFIFSCGHPVRMAMAQNDDEENYRFTLQLNKNRKTKEMTIIGNYLDSEETDAAVGVMEVTTYHKPFGEIAREIKEAGFVIDEIIEPKPLKEMEAIKPWSYQRLQKIPEFVIFKLLKR